MISLSSVWGFIKTAVETAKTWIETVVTIQRTTGELTPEGSRQLFEEYRKVMGESVPLSALRPDDPIPEANFIKVNWKTQEKYVYRVCVGVRYSNGLAESGLWKTIESSRRISKNELANAIDELFKVSYEGEGITEYSIEDYEFLESVWGEV